MTVSLDDVRDAARLLAGVTRRTPVEHSRVLGERTGGDVHLKCENLQRTGSFKLRGAYTRIARMPADELARGVVAASAGNHAQGVALAARLLGTRATVVMPETASLPKVQATRAYGAQVLLHGHTVEEALAEAGRVVASTGAVLVHPFDHPDVVAGQGTVGLELLEQVPDARTVLVCTGGGGLLAGVAVAVKEQRPDVRVVGVQAQEAAAYPASLAAGHPIALERMATMADGIAVGRPGDVPYELVRRHVDDLLTVTEEQLARAVLLCLERAKLVVEPAGAAAVAALLDAGDRFEPPVVAVLSGGNVDPLLLHRLLTRGLAAAGRYLSFRVVMPDRPGGLHALLGELAAAEASVLEVEHARTGAGLGIDEVEVLVRAETRGGDHAAEVMHRLAERGYRTTPAS